MAVRGSGGTLSATYTWLTPAVVNKDAKYSVVHGDGDSMKIRLVYRLNHSERELLTTDQHHDLVKLVNAIKEEIVGSPGGAFYINEYSHVLVPAAGRYYFAGTYESYLEFHFEGDIIGPRVPAGVEPGDPWPGPHVGIPYVLAAGGQDIKCKIQVTSTRIREEKLSSHVGREAAARLCRRLSKVKGMSGGRIYINEAREFFAPIDDGREMTYVYLGPLGDDVWFPPPNV